MLTKNVYYLLVCFLLASRTYAQNDCAKVFDVVKQSISVKTDKQYLENLNTLYSATSQQDLDTKSKSSVGISIPKYGVGDWYHNKSKVQKISNKYEGKSEYSLSKDEILELNETFSRTEDVQAAIKAWNSCIVETYGTIYLELNHNDDSTVIVSFLMKTNDFKGPDDKVKVTNISYSSNLTLIKGDITGKKINYVSVNTLTFKRSDSNQAKVLVDLAVGNIIPIEIPKVTKEILPPVYEKRIVQQTYQVRCKINRDANWIKIIRGDHTRTIKFPNQGREHYILEFKIPTTLKNKKHKIKNCFYTPDVGGITDFKFKDVIINSNGTLSINCYLVTGANLMSGYFTIVYEISEWICVANCIK